MGSRVERMWTCVDAHAPGRGRTGTPTSHNTHPIIADSEEGYTLPMPHAT